MFFSLLFRRLCLVEQPRFQQNSIYLTRKRIIIYRRYALRGYLQFKNHPSISRPQILPEDSIHADVMETTLNDVKLHHTHRVIHQHVIHCQSLRNDSRIGMHPTKCQHHAFESRRPCSSTGAHIFQS